MSISYKQCLFTIVFVVVLFTGCAHQILQQEASLKRKPEVITQEGCLVYSPSLLPNETISWSGECVEGEIAGQGELTWYLNGEPTGVYRGEFQEGKPSKRGIYQHLAVSPDPSEQLRVFTKIELSQYNGQNGSPAYVAYKGEIYDVSHSFLWISGLHYDSHFAGEDLTESFSKAPHKGTEVLAPFPVVGTLADTEAEPSQTQIKPRRISEECVELQPHQRLVFSFRVSKPVHFNLHYHEGEEVFYPILEEKIAAMDGEFVYHNEEEHPDEIPRYFCLMWKNLYRTHVTLEYEYSILDK